MKSKTYLSSIAKNDIKLFVRRFNAEDPEKGQRFLEELKRMMLIISKEPEKKAVVYDEIRICEVLKFSVNIHYHYNQEVSETLITSVFPSISHENL